MNKAYFFAMFLLAASFTGCIDEKDETLEPVGTEDDSGQPGVEFIGIFEDYGDRYLVAAIYDSNGFINSYSVESTNSLGELEEDCIGYGIPLNHSNIDTEYDCYPIYNSIIIELCYDLEYANQTVTVKVEDNDGNHASAEYDLVTDDFDEWCEDFEDNSGYPIATFFVQESSSGIYHVEVIMVSSQVNLTDFSYFLKDTTGSTYVGGNGFGEIAMQIIGGQEHGIDTSYSDSCDDNCDSQLESRASNVSTDDGATYPVHFSDNDRDGKLSAGDQFMVYGMGNSANGPAEDNWRLDIQYDASGDIVGSAKML